MGDRWRPYVLPCGHTCAEHDRQREGSGCMPCDSRQYQKPLAGEPSERDKQPKESQQ